MPTRAGRSAAWPRAPACSRPGLATMLVVLTTDAVVEPGQLRWSAGRGQPDQLRPGRHRRVHVHQRHRHPAGSGASGVTPDADEFTAALTEACRDLALQLLADAEGAAHDIAIEVPRAASEDDAVEVGRAVARSNLFKCAIFGGDPNWGRVLAASAPPRGLRPGPDGRAFNGVGSAGTAVGDDR